MELTQLQRKITKRYISRLGMGLFVMAVISLALQYLLRFLFTTYFPQAIEQGWFLWGALILSQYVVAAPIAWLIMRPVPPVELPKHGITPAQFLLLIPMCYAIMFVGSLIGQGVSYLLGLAMGTPPVNDLLLLIDQNSWLSVLTVAVFAPIVEELVFRKLLIDRLARYGQWVAVLVSGLLFGLYHGNFQQFFYAFGVGMAFGFIYVKTGKIWYTMLLHGIVNTIPFLLLPVITGSVESESMAGVFPLLAAVLCLLCAVAAGIALLAVNKRRIVFSPRVSILPQKGWGRIVWGTPGMVLILIACGAMFVMNTAPWDQLLL